MRGRAFFLKFNMTYLLVLKIKVIFTDGLRVIISHTRLKYMWEIFPCKWFCVNISHAFVLK